MSAGEQPDYFSRLNFLYNAVNDTQNTIRFIDTKAAFCVTLLSAMVAGVLQAESGHHTPFYRISFLLFLASVGLSLLVCLRVIFPVIKPHSAPSTGSTRALPKYFIHHQKSHHWLRHTFSNSVDDVLVDDHDSYTSALSSATDSDLLVSMCDEMLMVSLIRQIKQDRLHTAMFSILLSIFSFLAAMCT